MCLSSGSSSTKPTNIVNTGQKAQIATSSEELTPSGSRRKIKEDAAARRSSILTSQQGTTSSPQGLGGKTLLGT